MLSSIAFLTLVILFIKYSLHKQFAHYFMAWNNCDGNEEVV